ncbi:MAG TPA: hypothetical protein VK837_02350 [Longimicrobiales bacterium]|nr:hypothetical protein [Longimicrobiales bacterium]
MLALVPGGLAAQTRAADAAVVRAEVVASVPVVDRTALIASASSVDPAMPVPDAPATATAGHSARTTRASREELLSGPLPGPRLRAAPSPPEVRIHTEPRAAGARVVVVRIET